MKKDSLLTLLILLILSSMAGSAVAQVNDDNEDGVVKMDANSSRYNYVPGQVLIKFKDTKRMNVRRVGAHYSVADAPQLNALLEKYGVENMELLLPNEKPSRQMKRAKAYNGATIEEHDLSQLYCITIPMNRASETRQMIEELKGLPDVEFAEPNYLLHTLEDTICDDYSENPYVSQQWYLDDYGVKGLWDKPIINPERPVIAIIDTGVDMTHPDLVDNLWVNTAEAEGEPGYDNDGNGFESDLHGWDFVNNTPNVRDFNMHGTHVAGIAAAANNGIGIVGANPRALIMPVSVMQSDGSGDVATIIKGINYAVQNGATVLNLSLGTYANSRALRQALENAYQAAVIVAAAGNDGIPIERGCSPFYSPMFPAAYSFVLGVQAATEDGGLAAFSNFDCNGPNYSESWSSQDNDGFNYELQAPGANMLSTIPGGKYKVLQGTSMAAPLVAGAISALKMVKQYDTQEILWGDLTHTSNIFGAYNLTESPAELELIQLQLKEHKEQADETEEDFGGDGEVDAGETVDIYPVFRTTWGAANNIRMHLEMGEYENPDVVEILSQTVDFGSNLSSYGKGVSENPLRLKVANGVADGRHIRMKLVATCDGTTDTFEKEFVLIVCNMVKIGGLINEDRTLTADHVYYVNESLAIPEGVTLTIEPGTRLEFAEGKGLSSNGRLVANGTPEKPIVLTGHNGVLWAGVGTHESRDGTVYFTNQEIYTNADSTLFTIKPTEQTPYKITNIWKEFYADPNTMWDLQIFHLYDYIGDKKEYNDYIDLTDSQNLLTDPDYLTPSVLQLMADFNNYVSQFPTSPTEQESCPYNTYLDFGLHWYIYGCPRDTLSYCRIDGVAIPNAYNYPYLKDCLFSQGTSGTTGLYSQLSGIRSSLVDIYVDGYMFYDYASTDGGLTYSNIVNNILSSTSVNEILRYSQIKKNNYFNTIFMDIFGENKPYYLGYNISTPTVDRSDYPSYLGSSREDIIRPHLYTMENAPTYGDIDLSNMPTRPYAEAHGIVWKVCVNGKDAQDEFEDLAPLGVGRHKFEVYFNRPMNKSVTPQITFGVREPYTQQAVDEDGSWNEEGTIYTAYLTITGKTKNDGLNRIYVQGAEDNEFFPCPYEKTRFNINIQAAGSMATGFMAEAGLGKVNLTWNNENNDFEDAMGFNVYRYTKEQKMMPVFDEWGNQIWETDEWGNWMPKQELRTISDTIRVNTEILDIEAMEYTDYEVKPNQTYYYYYKVLSTDLQEYNVSNVVAATPMTGKLGDANGSGDVDVADVITTVNYAANMDPKPFIFEAADMNTDQMIDILDIIGIIQKILNPDVTASAVVENVATYTIEDGTLYIESPVALAGVQVQLTNALDIMHNGQLTVAEDLNGFEHASAWLSEQDYLFLAYNMNGKTLTPGKHALLYIGDAQIASIRLSNTTGGNVHIEECNTSGIKQMITGASTFMGIYNLHGQRVAASAAQLQLLPKGVYIVDGKKIIKWK